MANLDGKVSEVEKHLDFLRDGMRRERSGRELLAFVGAAERALRAVRSHVRSMERKERRSDCPHWFERLKHYKVRVWGRSVPSGEWECRDCGKVFRTPKDERDTVPYIMLLESAGNPDFNQYAPVSEPEIVRGKTLAEMRDHAARYRDKWDLGGGNWVSPIVVRCGKPVARISYNGRVWEGPELGAREIQV